MLRHACSAQALAASPEGLVPGVGPVTLFGGVYEADAKMSELRDLFRMCAAPSRSRIKQGLALQANLGAAS